MPAKSAQGLRGSLAMWNVAAEIAAIYFFFFAALAAF